MENNELFRKKARRFYASDQILNQLNLLYFMLLSVNCRRFLMCCSLLSISRYNWHCINIKREKKNIQFYKIFYYMWSQDLIWSWRRIRAIWKRTKNNSYCFPFRRLCKKASNSVLLNSSAKRNFTTVFERFYVCWVKMFYLIRYILRNFVIR